MSDAGGVVATPFSTIPRSGDPATDRRRVAEVVSEVEAGMVVVGLPLSLDGRVGPAAAEALEEAQALRDALGVPVETHDERLTSVTANRALTEAGLTGRRRRRARLAGAVDQAAAAVLLQSWLDSRQ